MVNAKEAHGSPDDPRREERARPHPSEALADSSRELRPLPELGTEEALRVVARRRKFSERLQRAYASARALQEPLGDVDQTAMHAASAEFNRTTYYRLDAS